VNDVVVLDSGPLGFLTNPNSTPVPVAIRQWLADLLAAGRRVVLPEIADYELRREYIRANLQQALVLLDSLAGQTDYLPLNTAAMRRAAELWAQARTTGQPTAPDPALDADVILAAQALCLNTPVVIATGNLVHLARFVPADLWSNITP
jgi:predicted nucleic acid-binding protein